MSAVTRKKKLDRLRQNMPRKETLDRLRGTGPDANAIRHRARWAVADAWGISASGWMYGSKLHPPPRSEDASPWDMTHRDGKAPRLLASWEHLRALLPNVRVKKAWGLEERLIYEALVRYEVLARNAVREGKRKIVEFVAEEERDEPWE